MKVTKYMSRLSSLRSADDRRSMTTFRKERLLGGDNVRNHFHSLMEYKTRYRNNYQRIIHISIPVKTILSQTPSRSFASVVPQ